MDRKEISDVIWQNLIQRGETLVAQKDRLTFLELVELKDIGTCLCRIACEMKSFWKASQVEYLFEKGDSFWNSAQEEILQRSSKASNSK
jgi:hypothetical protein